MKKYIYIVSILFIIGIIVQSAYQATNKKSAKSSRIECHKKTTVFERIMEDKLKPLKDEIFQGNYTLNIEKEEAKYMQTKLFSYVDIQKVKEQFIDILGVRPNGSKKSVIDVLVYENDKEDPGKKTAKSKQYAGYLVFSFKYENRLVYKLQIDFMDHQGKDIIKVLDCAKRSFESIK